MASIKEMLAKKKAAAAANTGPATKPTAPKTLGKAAAAEADSEEDDEEEEAPVSKKPVAKAPVKKAATKTPAKKAKAAEEEEEEPEVPVTTRRSGGFGKKPKAEATRRELKPGDWMSQDEFFQRVHDALKETLGDGAPESKATTITVVKTIEATMAEILENYDLKWCGVKFRRTQIQPRIFTPASGLSQVGTPYHTLVSGHTKVALYLNYGKELTRGTVDDSGDFIEGQFDAKGKFVPGTWEGDKFTPAKKK